VSYLSFASVFFVAGLLHIGLRYLRSGHGGKFGRMVRSSDWESWHDEVMRRQRKIHRLEDELTQLEEAEPER
jgi:hypothetical protein